MAPIFYGELFCFFGGEMLNFGTDPTFEAGLGPSLLRDGPRRFTGILKLAEPASGDLFDLRA